MNIAPVLLRVLQIFLDARVQLNEGVMTSQSKIDFKNATTRCEQSPIHIHLLFPVYLYVLFIHISVYLFIHKSLETLKSVVPNADTII